MGLGSHGYDIAGQHGGVGVVDENVERTSVVLRLLVLWIGEKQSIYIPCVDVDSILA